MPASSVKPMMESVGASQAQSSTTKRTGHALALGLVIAAFLVRIAFMLYLGTYRFDRRDDISDTNENTHIARSIAEGRGFSSPFTVEYTGPTAWVTPIYPYFLASVFKEFGVMSQRSYLVIQAIQSVFSALTVLPLIGIGTLIGSRRGGIAAATAWAFFPWFGRWALTWIWETSLSALLLASLVWYALWLAKSATNRKWAGFGLLWGFTLLVNPALASLLPLTLGYALWHLYRNNQSWLKPALIVATITFAMMTPWLIRNRVVMGQWVFLRDNFGFEFALGNYHYSFGRGWSGRHPSGNKAELARYREMGELNYVKANRDSAVAFVKQYPGEFVSLCAKRFLYFWDGSGMQYRGPVAWYWLPWSFALLSFLLLPALLLTRRFLERGWWLLFGVVLLYPIPYYLTHPPVRYRHIVEPVIVLLIATACTEGIGRLRSQSSAK
jgi:4-amino-4-deoxy-L-arabinose transferase-like glycosyltransferase